MHTRALLVAIAIVLLCPADLPGSEPDDGLWSAWDALLLESPSAADDPVITPLERQVLAALSPEQAAAYRSGDDPSSIYVGDGMTLAEVIAKALGTGSQLDYVPVPQCPLADTQAVGDMAAGETRLFAASGDDLSLQGGSSSGCGIPADAAAVLVAFRLRRPSGAGNGRLKAWARGDVVPSTVILDYRDTADALRFNATAVVELGEPNAQGRQFKVRTVNVGARVSIDVFGYYTPPPSGAGSGLDADLLDGQDAAAFAAAIHGHSGDEITSGTVAETVIDGAIARDAEIMTTVLSADGEGSGLDADSIDGLDSTAFEAAGTGWTLSGNAGTLPGSHFVGTTDGQPLEMRVNGSRALLLDFENDSPNVVGGYGGNTFLDGAPGQTIAGGGYSAGPNQSSGPYATIGGGQGNSVEANAAVISGGMQNRVAGSRATIGGGLQNEALSHYSTIAGGRNNTGTNYAATLGGGEDNTASGILSTVGGGEGNVAEGPHSTVPGGKDNRASGSFSFAAGRQATAAHEGAFVWADGTGAAFSSGSHHQFQVRASGGVAFYSDAGSTTGVSLPPGAGAWSTVSDVNLKGGFASLAPVDVLARLVNIPIQTWSYASQDASIRHMGPTAQDFWTAFGLGESERRISTTDADGVALASIQGLHQLLQAKEQEIADLEQRVADLEALVTALVNGQ
jgi:hypothetical protein